MTPDDVRAYEALAKHDRLADFVSLTRELLDGITKRSGWSAEAAVKSKAEALLVSFDDAATDFGNVLTVLERGPGTGPERALAAALVAHALAEAPPKSPDDEERIAAELLFLATRTPFDPTGLVDRALGDGAREIWTQVGDRIEKLDKGELEPQGQGEALCGAAALALSTSEAARSRVTALANVVRDPAVLGVLRGSGNATAKASAEPFLPASTKTRAAESVHPPASTKTEAAEPFLPASTKVRAAESTHPPAHPASSPPRPAEATSHPASSPPRPAEAAVPRPASTKTRAAEPAAEAPAVPAASSSTRYVSSVIPPAAASSGQLDEALPALPRSSDEAASAALDESTDDVRAAAARSSPEFAPPPRPATPFPSETAREEAGPDHFAGELVPPRRGPVVTLLLALTGILLVLHAVRLIARLALAYRRPAEVTLTRENVRIKSRTEVLGRTLRERETVIARSGLFRASREVRYPYLAFFAGLLALCAGSYLGVSSLVDGVRAASPSMLLTGIALIGLGVAIDFVLGTLAPGVRGRVRLEFVPRKGRRVAIGGIDAKVADAALRRLAQSR